MAKLKFGMIVVEGRGKLGGHVLSRNRGGAYARTKVSPVNPSTVYQQGARNRMATRAQAWRTLTQAQRDAWNNAVDDFQKTDVFGDIRKPSGQNLFTLININLVNSGAATVSVPPLPSETPPIVATSATIAVGTTQFDVAFTGTGGATDFIHIWATDGLSPGISYAKNRLRFLGSVAGNSATPEDIWALYTARFGTPTVGTKIIVQLVGVASTGQQGVPSETSGIVAA
jgi:hypothetical protein